MRRLVVILVLALGGNGVLYDLHPGQTREESVLVTQTSLFRLTRFYLGGPKAGRDEVVLDGITGPSPGGIYLANEALGAEPEEMNHVVRLKGHAELRPQ